MRPKIKVCCIASVEEAKIAIEEGADALGLVGQMPSGPGTISIQDIATIASAVPPPISTFMLTSEVTADAISAQINATTPSTVQIVSHINQEESKRLSKLQPHIRRVQVIHIEGVEALELIPIYAPFVHAFLLDSGRPGAAVPEFGGTGRTHDWSVSRKCVEKSPLPVFLAGGLNAKNIQQAIRKVRPFGVDLCSGVRTNNLLNRQKLNAFVAAALTA